MRIIGAILGVGLAGSWLFGGWLSAQAADYGGGSVRSYGADSQIDYGTIVELTGKNSDKVKVGSKDQLQNMFGVVVDPRQIPVKLSSGNLKNEVYVAVSGTYNVLVSTQGGDIQAGDFLTMSSINGIAMKAGTKESTVFGRAGGSFASSDPGLGSTKIKDTTSSSQKSVKLGSVPVTIDVKSNPNKQSTETNLPDFLERIGQEIAQKEVSPVRIYLSMAIAAVSLVMALIVIYAGVRNGVIAIGRNPMSKKSIFRALLEVILTSLVILIIGLFAVYLLLRL